MRGRIQSNPSFIAVVDLDARIRPNHPLRKIKEICDKALQGLNSEFDQAYKVGGRPSIPPEQLLKGSLLQIIYGIRSERQLCERIEDSLTFRWFLDLPLDQEAWDFCPPRCLAISSLAWWSKLAKKVSFPTIISVSMAPSFRLGQAPKACSRWLRIPTMIRPQRHLLRSRQVSLQAMTPSLALARTSCEIFGERHSQIPLIDQAQTRILALLVRAAIQPPSPATWATR